MKFKKKSPVALQIEMDNQIKQIMENPALGYLKKGALQGIRVHKFKYKTQLYLLSYEIKNDTLCLYLIGTHENYYKKLQKFLS